MNATDMLAYLVVLNHGPTLQKISATERQLGAANIMGCLHRVEDFFVEKDWREVLSMLKQREKLNGRCPLDNPELLKATASLSEAIYRALHPTSENPAPLDSAQQKFLAALDKEFSRILGVNR